MENYQLDIRNLTSIGADNANVNMKLPSRRRERKYNFMGVPNLSFFKSTPASAAA